MKVKRLCVAMLSTGLWMVLAGFALPALAAKATTVTTLAVSSAGSPVTTVASGSVITLAATVKAGSTPVTLGQVNFCDASAAHCTDLAFLGTAQLTSTGVATIRFVPPPGTHSYKAFCFGNRLNAPSESSSSSLVVTGSHVGSYPTTSTISPSGSPGNYTLTARVAGHVDQVGLDAPSGTVSFVDTSNEGRVLAHAELGSGVTNLTWPNPQTVPLALDASTLIAIGDFNGDGYPDFVAEANAMATVMLGHADGTFTVSQTFSVFYGIASLATADFNSDGKLDLVFDNDVFLGNGDGTFQSRLIKRALTGLRVVGDFNGDGRFDLAMLSGNNVNLLVGVGDGTFTAGSSTPVGTGSHWIASGDLNNDGKMDVVVSNRNDGTVSVLLGDGDGTFTAAPTPTAGVGPGPIAVGDFNGDGIPDLVVLGFRYPDQMGKVTVLLGNGDGSFAPALISSNTFVNPASVSTGDFNGDGKLDLAFISGFGSEIQVLLGNGDGTLNLTPGTKGSGGCPTATVALDLNADGRSDLAILNQNATVSVMLSHLEPTASAMASGISLPGSLPHLMEVTYPGDSVYEPSVSGVVALPKFAALVSPASLVFANQNIKTWSRVQTAILTNLGNGELFIGGVALAGQHPGQFLTSNNCGAGIAPAAFCTIRVRFDPRIPQAVNATLEIIDNAGDSPQWIQLAGTGTFPTSMTLSSTSITFATQNAGVRSPLQTVSLTNIGNEALILTSVALTGANPGEFLSSNNCGASVAPHQSCTLGVRFNPRSGGVYRAALTLTDNGMDSPQSIQLSGDTFQTPVLQQSTAAVGFGGQAINQRSASQTVTLHNTGDASLYLTSMTIAGAHPGQYVTDNNCNGKLLAGSACTVRLSFYPRIPGELDAVLLLTDNAAGSPQSISLTGMGK